MQEPLNLSNSHMYTTSSTPFSYSLSKLESPALSVIPTSKPVEYFKQESSASSNSSPSVIYEIGSEASGLSALPTAPFPY